MIYVYVRIIWDIYNEWRNFLKRLEICGCSIYILKLIAADARILRDLHVISIDKNSRSIW